MGQVCLISGPPGCGKTTWALQRLQRHQGPCAYLRLEGEKAAGLEQGDDSGIDLAWLKDQVPRLEEPATANATDLKQDNDGLTLIEVQQFHPPSKEGVKGSETTFAPSWRPCSCTPTNSCTSGETLNCLRRTPWSSGGLRPGIPLFRVVSGIPTA